MGGTILPALSAVAVTLRGRDEAMAGWLRQREIGDLERELAGLEDQLRLTPPEVRHQADLYDVLDRLRQAEDAGPRPAGRLL